MRAKTFSPKWYYLVAIPVLAAMGSSSPPPGPVQLPRANVPDAVAIPEEEPAPAAPTVSLEIHDAAEVEPAQFRGEARILAVFADNPNDPAFRREIALLNASPSALLERDVVVITDTNPAAASAWRQWLRPEGFVLVLVDNDGQVKLRKPVIWDVREIIRAIDKFPSRRVETGRAILP